MPDSQIKNLIFDLGGVILDLSIDHTLESFSQLSGTSKTSVEKIFNSTHEFLLYEKGLISDDEFRNSVRSIYGIQASDETLDKSWNAMLRGIPFEKLELLNKLKTRYNVYLLSNTNTIHLNYINDVMLPPLTGGKSLEPFFHKAYYSHLMKMRKPDAEIFETVLKENSLKPGETLFLDDNASNIEGASRLGIQTVHVLTPTLMLDYFHE
jgi:putative hydrolase of the HAD superfamily